MQYTNVILHNICWYVEQFVPPEFPQINQMVTKLWQLLKLSKAYSTYDNEHYFNGLKNFSTIFEKNPQFLMKL